jgi:hypothetical protein
MNDGSYLDPYEISGVTVFKKSANISPSSILGDDGLIDPTVSSSIVAHFEISAVGDNGVALDSSNYSPASDASGIYYVKEGQYVAVLDGIVDLSGHLSFWGEDAVVPNTASTVDEYIDVWTIRNVATSDLKTVLHEFRLYDDSFVSITEPLMIRSSNKLTTKKIQLNSKRDLKITTEFVIENKAIDESIKNLFKDSIATDAQIEIVKINTDPNLAGWVTVSSFSDTTDLVEVTSRNTFIFNWDTSALLTHPEYLGNRLGDMKGTYFVRVKYNLLNEVIYSPRFHILVI